MAKGVVIKVRVDELTNEDWQHRAEAKGLTLSEWIRAKCMESGIASPVSPDRPTSPKSGTAVSTSSPAAYEAIKATWCKRCQRVGKVKDCPQCAELQA